MKAVKRMIAILLALMLLAGCSSRTESTSTTTPVSTPAESSPTESTPVEPTVVISPLPDSTMDNLTDAILSVSFEEGSVYVDDSGILQMDAKIYSYDQYDMVEVSMLKVGDTIETHSGEVNVASLEKKDDGTILINGGIEKDGLNLVTDGNGIFYEITADDEKKWYEVGEATIRVSTEFIGYDNSDPAQGEVLMYPGGFVTNEVSNYDFSPLNTTIRVENGQIIELNRW